MKSIRVLNMVRPLPSEPLKAQCTYLNICSVEDSDVCVDARDICTYDHAGCYGGAMDECGADYSACSGYLVLDSCSIDSAGCCVPFDSDDTCGVDTCGWYDYF